MISPTFSHIKKIYIDLRNKLDWALVVVLLISLLAALLQFSNQWLSGWDTLHPEFDYSLHLSRSFDGVWREDQGLGAVAAHSHMSELPRIIILFLLDLIFPTHLVKQIFVLSTLVIGPIGIYLLIKQIILISNEPVRVGVKKVLGLRSQIKQKLKKDEGSASENNFVSSLNAQLAAVVGSLWYLMNLGTVQHYVVVFEMFAVQYAALGWIFYLAIQYLLHNKPKQLAYFFLASFLASSMAYASLLWFAYAASLAIFSAGFIILSPSIRIIKRIIILGLTTLGANAYWLLPNLYFLLSEASSYSKNSHMNRLFSPEAFFQNQAYGQIENLAIIKNFLFNWFVVDENGQSLLLETWHRHLELPIVLSLGYGVALAVFVGVIIALRNGYKNKSIAITIIPVWFFSLVMLINQNYFFAPIFSWLRQQSSLFEEGLRFPFTKFSLIFMMTSAIFLGYFLYHLLQKLEVKFSSHHKSYVLSIKSIILFITIGSLFAFSLPIWKGQLIHNLMKADIPAEYFEAFEFARTLPSQSRIAILPLETHSGWHSFNWGHLGPGFWWFGLRQPVLTRDFDRWSPYNESFYNQLSTAFYNQDINQIVSIINQYDVDFFLLDESLVIPNADNPSSDSILAKEILGELGPEQIFSSDLLSIYDLRPLKPEFSRGTFLFSAQGATPIGATSTYSRTDPIFQRFQNYYKPTLNSQDTQYPLMPFADIFSLDPNNIRYDDSEIVITSILSDNFIGKTYKVALDFQNNQILNTAVKVDWREESLMFLFPTSKISSGQSTVNLPSLPSFEVLLSDIPHIDTEELVISVNNTPILVKKNETTVASISLPIGREFRVFVINQSQTDINQQTILIEEEESLLIRVSEDIWDAYTSNNLDLLKIYEPYIRAEIQSFPIDVDMSSDNFENCDYLSRGHTSKSHISGTSYSFLANEYGVGCDRVFLPNINTHASYAIRWQGENISGRSLKFYLSHGGLNKDIQEELLPRGVFDKSFVTFPWTNIGNHNYTLHWENKSFGQVAENKIDRLAFYNFPAEQLSKLVLLPDSDSDELRSSSPIEIESSRKISNSLYFAEISVLRTGEESSDLGLLTLSQSYNQGWIAFSLNGLDTQILDHTIADGWANSWLLSEGDHMILIFFWPQLLSVIGYGALLLTSILVIPRRFNNQ